MSKRVCLLNAFTTSALIFVFVALTQAQSNRTFVSADKHASDKNQCTHDDPCRSIQRALDAKLLNRDGTVVILESGDYDPFIISGVVNPPTQTSATVEAAPGVHAGITATGGANTAAITIQAGATDTVVLRGLTLSVTGNRADFGIDFQTGTFFFVESCVVNGFDLAGLRVARNIANDLAEVSIKDSVFRNMSFRTQGAGTGRGVLFSNTGSNSKIRVSVDNSRFEQNQTGILVEDNTFLSMRNSFVAGNTFGLGAKPSRALTAELNVENCLVTNNYEGVFSFSATVRVSNSTITNNYFGLDDHGTVFTRGNNTVEGNANLNCFCGGASFAAK